MQPSVVTAHKDCDEAAKEIIVEAKRIELLKLTSLKLTQSVAIQQRPVFATRSQM
jgi:hypothetical protein